MRILVTGYKGFIGQNMIRGLLDHDLHLCDWGDSYSLHKIDRVIHLGGISDTTCQDWAALRKQNVEFSVVLMERCKSRGIPIQIASSASVYGPNNTTFKETDPVAPANRYAESKAMMEAYYHRMHPASPVQIFRYFNVYGPFEDHKGGQASPQHKFRGVKEVELFEGSEEIKRDFVPVETVVDVHKKFLNIPESGIWNIGTGVATSFAQVARDAGAKIRYKPMPEELKYGYQAYTRADTCSLNDTLRRYGHV